MSSLPDTDDEELREMPRETLSQMLWWLTEGNTPEELAMMVLERMSEDERNDIIAAMEDQS